ncbi:MAG: carbon-nitrogen hydrolase family protein [Pirellulaceae bacterium]|nr:carbon-nitrogen hydrolase family protein [Pirellulaceae bacterium]
MKLLSITQRITLPSWWLLTVMVASGAWASELARLPAKLDGHSWTEQAPRDEVRPRFFVTPADKATPANNQVGPALGMQAEIAGVDGWWQTELPIQGGQTYQVSLQRQIQGVSTPHRSTVVRIDWLNAKNQRVPSARPFVKGILEGYNDMQQPDYLEEPRTKADWQLLTGTFLSPPTAVKARLELHLRWCDPGATVHYLDLKFEAVQPVKPRLVKLATIHLQPRGGNLQANREAFVPVVTEAAQAGAQLIVLPETLPYYGTGLTPLESAETVPGPSTEFFGALAKKLQVHIVTTCFEKDGHHLFNTAMLMGPDGQMIGRYRKVCIPRGEIEAGVEPGTEYPVFETKLGRIGMMICYDGFFPQVAQRLTDNGAEVIAFPVWGCNPLLVRARAAENQVAIVSSTYTEPDRDWMISAVYDPNGAIVAQATKWGTFALAELDLSRPPYWPSLGTHRSERFHHQP